MTITLYNASESIFDAVKKFVSQWHDIEIEATEDPNTETLAAMRECEDMEAHPEKYTVYSSWADAKKAMLDEI